MSIMGYLAVLRARWVTVLVFTLLGVVAGGSVVALSPQEFRSTATLYVASGAAGDATTAYQGSLLSQERVKSYRQLLASDRVADQVAARLGDVTGADLTRDVTVTNTPETTLLLVTVTAGNPERAALVANTYGDVFAQVAGTLETRTPGQGIPAVTVRTALAATPDPTPTSPRPLADLLAGLVVGLLAGAAVAVARTSLDRRVSTSAQLAELTAAPDLGHTVRDQDVAERILHVLEHPRSTGAEAIRKLRSNLRFVTVDRAGAVVMVTSAQAGEGKSTTSANLAASLAELGEHVLLIEADLRRPGLGAALGLEATVGLTTVLCEGLRPEEAVQRVGRFDVLLAGSVPPNPSELLDSQRMARTLDELRGRYDWILVDSAPLLPVTDSAVLARHCDGVVLLARHGATSRVAARAAADALRAAGAVVLGSVLTLVPKPDRAEGYGYYGSYTSYGAVGEGAESPVAPALAPAGSSGSVRTGAPMRPSHGPAHALAPGIPAPAGATAVVPPVGASAVVGLAVLRPGGWTS